MEHFLAPEVFYSLMIFILFVVPRILLRYEIPPALTAFGFGIFLGPVIGVGLGDPTIQLLATIGISALFLFAGLEVELEELIKQKRILIQHVAIRFTLLTCSILILVKGLAFSLRDAGLFSLALFTPSVGFILDQLDRSDVTKETAAWIKNLAIAAELVALVLMFALSKSDSASDLGISSVYLVVLMVALPALFKGFVRYITPHAPGSEFSFLLMMAIMAGMITKKIGAYYLVGAFIVGVIARRFENSLQSMPLHNLMQSLKLFASFFMPFYFLRAGINLKADMFSIKALFIGFIMVAVVGFIRVFTIMLHRKVVLRETFLASSNIALSLLPNLVFGLVMAGMLIEYATFPREWIGALIIYTITVTVLPTILGKIFHRKIMAREVDYLPG